MHMILDTTIATAHTTKNAKLLPKNNKENMKLLPRPIPLTACRAEETGLCNNSLGDRNKLDGEWETKLLPRRRR